MRNLGTWLLGAWLALPWLPAVAQPAVHWPIVHLLPTTESVANWHPPAAFKFKVRPATAADLAGRSADGIPAWQLEVLTGTGDWDRGSPAPPPEYVLHSAADVRGRIALFKGSVFDGWLTVPRGWRVQDASEGVDGSGGVTFVASGGARDGWIAYSVIPACVGCILGSADGLFPDAHRRWDAFLGTRTPPETLLPKPDSLTYPDRCTALITYRSGALTVESIQFWLPPLPGGPDPYSTGMTVALPADETAVRDYLITAFERTRPASQRSCPETGW